MNRLETGRNVYDIDHREGRHTRIDPGIIVIVEGLGRAVGDAAAHAEHGFAFPGEVYGDSHTRREVVAVGLPDGIAAFGARPERIGGGQPDRSREDGVVLVTQTQV